MSFESALDSTAAQGNLQNPCIMQQSHCRIKGVVYRHPHRNGQRNCVHPSTNTLGDIKPVGYRLASSASLNLRGLYAHRCIQACRLAVSWILKEIDAYNKNNNKIKQNRCGVLMLAYVRIASCSHSSTLLASDIANASRSASHTYT